jgi:hypothetical protein
VNARSAVVRSGGTRSALICFTQMLNLGPHTTHADQRPESRSSTAYQHQRQRQSPVATRAVQSGHQQHHVAVTQRHQPKHTVWFAPVESLRDTDKYSEQNSSRIPEGSQPSKFPSSGLVFNNIQRSDGIHNSTTRPDGWPGLEPVRSSLVRSKAHPGSAFPRPLDQTSPRARQATDIPPLHCWHTYLVSRLQIPFD